MEVIKKELFYYRKLQNKDNKFAVNISSSSKAMKYFDKFMYIIGDRKSKSCMDIESGDWIISEYALNKLIKLNDEVFPAKKDRAEKRITAHNNRVNKIFGSSQKIIDSESAGLSLKLKPYKYQQDIIKFATDNEKCLIVAGCGAGKTACLLGIFSDSVNLGKITPPGLIVVKASLKAQWNAEVSKFTDYRSKILDTYSKCKNEEAFNKQFEDVDLMICNYETLNDDKVRAKLHKMKLDFISCDEINMGLPIQ